MTDPVPPCFARPVDYKPPAELAVLYDTPSVSQTVERLAREVHERCGQEFLIVGLLKGSFVFIADLVRALHRCGCAPQVDFMTISSYGDGRTSSGTLAVHRDVSDDLRGKPVLLVDDILESGRTLHFARTTLLERGAQSVSLCVLLDKPGKRTHAIEAEHVGYRIPDRFVVGYGLDYAGYYRELPFIGVLD